MSNTCLICGKPVNGTIEYHQRCSKSFFGVYPPPSLDLSINTVQQYAAQSVLARATVTGVQKKLSLGIEHNGKNTRLTVVGLWGNYILKPPSDEYPFLPENEDTIMHTAATVKIPVVPHALIRLSSGELAYITRRIDRDDSEYKIAMEDFCQITERLTEDKYKGSVERIGKLLQRHSIYSGLDTVDLFERVVFNYLIGNSDMHLKNYSLIETQQGIRLSQAYDLISTVLVIPEDPDESALTINGKKTKLKATDFNAMAEHLNIPEAARLKTYTKFKSAQAAMFSIVNRGRLPATMKDALTSLIEKRLNLFR